MQLVLLLDDGLPDGGALDAEPEWLTAGGYAAMGIGGDDTRRNLSTTVNQLGRQFPIRERPQPAPEGYCGPSKLSCCGRQCPMRAALRRFIACVLRER